VKALASVRLLKLLGFGVVVLMCPALSTAQALQEGSAELAPGVFGPQVFGRLLVAIQPLAGLIHLANVAIPPLATAVEHLLLLGVGPHPRGIQSEALLNLRAGGLSLILGLEGQQNGGVYPGVDVLLIRQKDVAPGGVVVGGVLGDLMSFGHQEMDRAIAHAVINRMGLGLVHGPGPVGHQISHWGVEEMGVCEHFVTRLLRVFRGVVFDV